KNEWAALRRRYEWDDSYDEDSIAPRDMDLEQELFGEENHVNTGINFSKYDNIKVSVNSSGGNQVKHIRTVIIERNIETISCLMSRKRCNEELIFQFEEANLHEIMKENIKLAKYTVPTPVQKYSIPIITDKNDLMACAQTGSGKTAAFLIPVLSHLFGKGKRFGSSRPQPGQRKMKSEPFVLILAPTRELATQIFDECLYGGADAAPQKSELAKGCDVLTATPGRLNDFLERGIVSLRRVKFLVLDEADRMLEMGFEDDIRKIVQKSDLLDDVGRVGGTTSDITQKIKYVEDKEKRNQLVELLLQQPPSRTVIFVSSKRGADSLDDFLYNQGFPSTSIHGDRSQREREDALISFKNGKSPILVATAVAARGLDIKNVMHVINYDLCDEIDEYVHRIGRTARVGNKGLATSFYNEKNSNIASDLVKILLECNQDIPDFLKQYSNDILYDEDDEREMERESHIGGSSTRGDQNQNPSWNATQIRPQWDQQLPSKGAYQDLMVSNVLVCILLLEVDVGMAADVGTLQRLPRIVGNDSLARELCLTGRKCFAVEALNFGLVNKVLETKEEALTEAIKTAEIIASKSPVATLGTKHLLNYSRDHSIREGLEYTAVWNGAMLNSKDLVEAINASIKKEKPTFSKL
ncbi:15642_t:CDS:10, partial [Acaulospora colombiana]